LPLLPFGVFHHSSKNCSRSALSTNHTESISPPTKLTKQLGHNNFVNYCAYAACVCQRKIKTSAGKVLSIFSSRGSLRFIPSLSQALSSFPAQISVSKFVRQTNRGGKEKQRPAVDDATSSSRWRLGDWEWANGWRWRRR